MAIPPTVPIYHQIKADRLAARKAKNPTKTSILTTLVGELETDAKNGKTIDDKVVIAKCKKFIKNNNDTAQHADGERFREIQDENYVLKMYVPRQMDATQIKQMIVGLGAENVGHFMKTMNSLYDGKFDKKQASQIAKEHFSGK